MSSSVFTKAHFLPNATLTESCRKSQSPNGQKLFSTQNSDGYFKVRFAKNQIMQKAMVVGMNDFCSIFLFLLSLFLDDRIRIILLNI